MGASPGRGQGGDVTIQHLLIVDEILILGTCRQSLAGLGDGRVHGAQNGFGFGRLLLSQGRGSTFHRLDEVVRQQILQHGELCRSTAGLARGEFTFG